MKYFMVVDDSDVIRTIITQTLTLNNYKNIFTASNGVEALTIIKQNKDNIGMYIFDLNMPEMDGITLLKEVRNIDKTTPIIMLTTETDKEKIMKAKEIGATGWIVKPFDGEKFIKVVNMFMKD